MVSLLICWREEDDGASKRATISHCKGKGLEPWQKKRPLRWERLDVFMQLWPTAIKQLLQCQWLCYRLSHSLFLDIYCTEAATWSQHLEADSTAKIKCMCALLHTPALLFSHFYSALPLPLQGLAISFTPFLYLLFVNLSPPLSPVLSTLRFCELLLHSHKCLRHFFSHTTHAMPLAAWFSPSASLCAALHLQLTVSFKLVENTKCKNKRKALQVDKIMAT